MKTTEDYPAQEPIEYVPPNKETLDSFAKTVCQRLGLTEGQSPFAAAGVQQELSCFLHVVATIYAKYLNKTRQNEADLLDKPDAKR